MPKKKKTRQQKILSEKRRETSTMSLYTLSSDSLPKQAKQPAVSVKQSTTVRTTSYTYLSTDLAKTAVFSGLIILIELLIRFFMK